VSPRISGDADVMFPVGPETDTFDPEASGRLKMRTTSRGGTD